MFSIPFLRRLSCGNGIRGQSARPSGRILRHEQLEDRRLLAGIEMSINDVTAVEGDQTGVFVDVFAPDSSNHQFLTVWKISESNIEFF